MAILRGFSKVLDSETTISLSLTSSTSQKRMMHATASPGCKFHLGCKSMRLSHMVFADDLMLFCKAEEASIKC